MVTNHLLTGMILQVDIIGSLSFHIHTGKFSHGNLKKWRFGSDDSSFSVDLYVF